MNKTSLMQQQESIRNDRVYNPAESLSTVANVMTPLAKSFAKSAGNFKSAGKDGLFVNPIGRKSTNIIIGNPMQNNKRNSSSNRSFKRQHYQHKNNRNRR